MLFYGFCPKGSGRGEGVPLTRKKSAKIVFVFEDQHCKGLGPWAMGLFRNHHISHFTVSHNFNLPPKKISFTQISYFGYLWGVV